MGFTDFFLIKNINFIFSGDASKLRNEYGNLLASVAEMNKFLGKMIMMLHKRDSLTDEELAELINHYTQLALPNLTLALTLARKNNNPLTPEEANKLQFFIDKANRGNSFLLSEINEYQQLVDKARREQSGEINPWPLIALAAFLLGLIIASRQ